LWYILRQNNFAGTTPEALPSQEGFAGGMLATKVSPLPSASAVAELAHRSQFAGRKMQGLLIAG
jgi:hypothetical protein